MVAELDLAVLKKEDTLSHLGQRSVCRHQARRTLIKIDRGTGIYYKAESTCAAVVEAAACCDMLWADK